MPAAAALNRLAALLLAASSAGHSDEQLEAWQLHHRAPVLVPRYAKEDGAMACAAHPNSSAVMTFFDSDVALRWLPWPQTTGSHKAAAPTSTLVGPRLRAETESADREQQQAHNAAISSLENPGAVLGYASWLTSDARRAERPLILRETAEHTGTRVWEATWLHRSWALDHPELFQPVSGVRREVFELGSGCGVLGLTVAASHRASVTLSDFSGHFQSGSSVVVNLWENAVRNQKTVESRGGRLRVLQLDWSQPSAPQHLSLPAGIEAHMGTVNVEFPRVSTPSDVAPADVLLATEVLYTERGAELFADAVAQWLRRPAGTLWLMNNPLRTGCVCDCEHRSKHCEKATCSLLYNSHCCTCGCCSVSRFPAICSARGLMVTEVEQLEWQGQARSMFSNQSAEAGHYTLYKVTWLSHGSGS